MTLDVKKLSKLCGMLSSDYDAERAIAAQRATALLRDAGMTWEELVTMAFEAKEPQRQSYNPGPQKTRRSEWSGLNVRSVCAQLHNISQKLTNWEKNFLVSIDDQIAKYGGCTEKQWNVLRKIAKEKGIL
jgi:hypothetical protein